MKVLLTPPSLRGTIEMPGNNGGANWGSSAVDPSKGTIYIYSKETPMGILLTAPQAPQAVGNKSWRNCAPPAARGGAGRGRGGAGAGHAEGGAPPLQPLAERRNWQAVRLRQRDNAEARRQGVAAAEEAVDVVGAGAAPAPPNTGDLTRYTQNYQFFYGTSNGTSIIGPPWSQLTAYDLNSGKILWQIPSVLFPD